MTFETVFSMDASSIKFGAGATREVGSDMKDLGARRVMVVTDPSLAGVRDRWPSPWRLCRKEGIDTVAVRPGADRAQRRVVQGSHRLRDRGQVRRLRGRRRRLDHGHGQGGQSLRHLSGGLPGLRQRPHRQGHARARAPEAAHRHPHHGRAPAARPPAWPSSTSPRCTPRPASPTGPCGPGWASSTPRTPAPCPRWRSPARPWTCSPTPSSR